MIEEVVQNVQMKAKVLHAAGKIYTVNIIVISLAYSLIWLGFAFSLNPVRDARD